MEEKSFTGDKSSPRMIEKHCVVDIDTGHCTH